MIKRILLIISLIFVFNSCKKNDQKLNKKTHDLIISNKSLSKTNNSLLYINDSLNKVIKSMEIEVSNLKKEDSENIYSRTPNYLKRFFPSKISLFKYIFEEVKKHNEIKAFLYHSDIFLDKILQSKNDNESFLNSLNKKNAFTYFFKTTLRDPKIILNLFSTEEKNEIFTIIKTSNWYKESDIKNNINALLLTYQDIENTETPDEVYKKIQSDNYDKWELTSEDTTDALTFTNKYGTFCCNGMLRYCQLFWSRRNIEGNKKVVFNLIKEFNEFDKTHHYE
ncbi:hypothetical protein [Tenacibaculum sp.]|uniref:hypothetical protein n=1 Tax=Tenacibaculum sp. TaxID=1906242 RepID=UPI003AA837BA